MSILTDNAKAARAWHHAGRIHVQTTDGREASFPVSANRILRGAAPEQLNRIEIWDGGRGLHWPDLDEDLTVQGILDGRYGVP